MRAAFAALFAAALTGTTLAQPQAPQQQIAPFQNNIPKIEVPQQPPARTLDSSGQFRAPDLPNAAAPKPLDSYSDKVTRCLHYGATSGVPADQLGEFSRECAHAQ